MRYRMGQLAAGLLAGLLLTVQPAAADELLVAAASEGDLATLRSLIEADADVNAARADGTTALAWAVYRDDVEAVDLLIASGADVNAANDYGVTPLSLACDNANAPVVRRLLGAGADPDRARVTGETPLMACAEAGSVDGVRALLEHGADVSARENKDHQTALMWAAAEGHPGVVRVLLEHGADVDTRSRVVPQPEPYVIETDPGLTVLGSNYPDTVYFPETSGGYTALHFAARQGDIDSVRALLEAGAAIDSPHREYGPPLVIAIASGHRDLALFLLESGADPNVSDAWGVTPLHYALHEGVLILNNFSPSETDKFGWRRHNMPGLVQALLDYGADPNARIRHSYNYLDNPFLARDNEDPPMVDPTGATPIMLAAASGDTESMQILEEASDLDATTVGGATILMLAAGAGAERGARNEAGALQATRLALKLQAGSVNDRLSSIAPDGPAKGMPDGRTALHFATHLGWRDMIRLLVEHGADLEATDRYGMTSLQIALGDPAGRYYRQVGDANYDDRFRRPRPGGNQRVAELLLELGAEPYTGIYRDRSGE